MNIKNWTYFSKVVLLYSALIFIFIFTYLIYLLTRGKVIGLKDLGFWGCEVIYANDGFAKLIACLLPILLFNVLIFFFIKKAKSLNLNEVLTQVHIIVFIFLWLCNLVFYTFKSDSPTTEMLISAGGC